MLLTPSLLTVLLYLGSTTAFVGPKLPSEQQAERHWKRTEGHVNLDAIEDAAIKSRQTKKQNVVVIMTDDQDLLLDSMSAMPNVKSLIGSKGVTYSKHYCQNAWCCPSRTSFFTGKTAHNTNVTDVCVLMSIISICDVNTTSG